MSDYSVELLAALRPMLSDDEGFVFRAWLSAFSDSDPSARAIARRADREQVFGRPHTSRLCRPGNESYHVRPHHLAWWISWHGIVEQLLRSPSTHTLLAHVIDEPSQLLGFVCATPPDALHWLYVKQAFRGLGIGTALLTAALPGATSGDCTFWSRRLLTSQWRYNPTRLKELCP